MFSKNLKGAIGKIMSYISLRGTASKKVSNISLNLELMQKRELSLWISWFIKIFNAKDRERVQMFGADVVCAEWLLRNGAAVRFKGHHSLFTDYNALIELEEAGEYKNYYIEEIFAKKASLGANGFEHFNGCKHVQKISLIFCSYIDSNCLSKLYYLKDSLKDLHIEACFKVEDQGILHLTELRNLEKLSLINLTAVKKKDECQIVLRKALKNCQINFTE